MRHALVFAGDNGLRSLLATVLEEEGYAVTRVMTTDDALMTLRSALHPIVTLVQLDYLTEPSTMSFFERVHDDPDRYGQHRYMAISAWYHSQDELDLLAGLGVPLLPAPFTLEQLIQLVERAFASLP